MMSVMFGINGGRNPLGVEPVNLDDPGLKQPWAIRRNPFGIKRIAYGKTALRYTLAMIQYITLLPLSNHADTPSEAMDRGRERYTQQEYIQALEHFTQAAETVEENELDPAVALYNLGNTYHQLKKYEEAHRAYQEALATPDLSLQSKIYFNSGNTHMAQAEELEAAQQLEPALQSVTEAIARYQNAMRLDEKDIDPKHNYELATIRLEELKKLIEEQPKQQQDEGDENEEQEQEQEQQESGEQEEEEQESSSEQNQQEDQEQDENQGEQQPAPQQRPPEEMTPEEAMLLLQALKEEEEANREQMRIKLGRPVPVDKDW